MVGANIVDVAKELAPYRTGFLRDSIYHRVDGTTLEVGATADYASYQEFGTHKMAPHSFLIPALDANLQNFVDAVRVALLNALGV